MRHDQPLSTAIPPTPAAPIAQASTPVRTWAWPIGMAVLTAITSLAVALYASAWLALGYLVMMALVLGVPSRRTTMTARPNRRPVHGIGSIRVPRVRRNPYSTATALPARVPEDPEVGRERGGVSESASVSSSSVALPASGSEPEPDPGASKAKRARPRPRKGKGGAATASTVSLAPSETSDAAVTWIRVGPGKFVRADASSPTLAQASPSEDEMVTWGSVVESAPPTFEESDVAASCPTESMREIEEVPAEPPGAEIAGEDAEDTGLELEGTKDGVVEDDPAEAAQGVSEADETEDNGIAPDAPVEPALDAQAQPFDAEPVTPEVEPLLPVEVPQDFAPEPAIDATRVEPETSRIASREEPGEHEPVACDDESQADGFDEARRHPETWSPAASWRETSRGRTPAHASMPDVGVQRTAPGNVRWTRVSHVRPGVRRSPRRGRGRGPGRFHKLHRTHPPRSPPRGSRSNGASPVFLPRAAVGLATGGRSRRLRRQPPRPHPPDQPEPGALGNVGTAFGMIGSPVPDIGFILAGLGAPIWGGGA